MRRFHAASSLAETSECQGLSRDPLLYEQAVNRPSFSMRKA